MRSWNVSSSLFGAVVFQWARSVGWRISIDVHFHWNLMALLRFSPAQLIGRKMPTLRVLSALCVGFTDYQANFMSDIKCWLEFALKLKRPYTQLHYLSAYTKQAAFNEWEPLKKEGLRSLVRELLRFSSLWGVVEPLRANSILIAGKGTDRLVL